jgi:hypothetical protein
MYDGRGSIFFVYLRISSYFKNLAFVGVFEGFEFIINFGIVKGKKIL